MSKICHSYGIDRPLIGSDFIAKCQAYSWPGNIRELQNLIERTIIFPKNEVRFPEEKLPGFLEGELDFSKRGVVPTSQIEKWVPSTYESAKEDFELNYFHNLLDYTRGNISEAARVSGKFRSDVYRAIKKHGLDVKHYLKSS